MRRCSPIPPVVPPVSRFPRCAKPRKSVVTVNGLSPDANGNVNAGDVRREDFSGVEPKEKMTLNEVGAKVNEVIGRLGGAADAAAASPRASGYGPGTPLGDVHPDTALRDVVEASGMSADGVRAIASEVVAPVAASVTDLRTAKLDKSDVVDPSAAAEDGKAADAKKTQEEMDRILGVASGAMALAESKADKLSSRQLEAVNSGIDAGKVAKIAQNESAISAEVSRATTEEARLRELVNAIKTFDAVVADSLPVPSEKYRKKLYLVPSTNPETRNVKDEFICVKIEDVWSWEQVGSTAVTIEFDDEPTEGSQKAARSGGIWSWVKSLLPRWLTSDYTEPATVASVANKADKTVPYADGNLAALTADGNLADSGKNASDFLPASSSFAGSWDVYDMTTFRGEFSVGPNGDLLGITYEHGSLYKFGDKRWYYGESQDPASEIAVKGDISALESSKADISALNDHTTNTNNPHAVTAAQVGALSISRANTDQTFDWNPSGGGVRLFGTHYGTGIGLTLNSVGGELLNYHDDTYDWYKLPTGKSGTLALVDDISATNPTFSDAALAVGLNIDASSVAVLNEIAATFGGFPLGAGETATTVGGLLAALSAAAAWLKKNKVGSFASVGGASATVENGVAKLGDFFTESNSLLTATIAANSARLALDEDGEIIVTMNTED